MHGHVLENRRTEDAGVIAFIDESILMQPAGVYVLAAVVVDGDLDSQRHTVRSAVPRRRGRRWHWHSEEHDDRCTMLDVMNRLQLDFVVSWSSVTHPRGQERSRAIALQRLLWEFKEMAITEVVFESRRTVHDNRDRATIAHAQRAGQASVPLSYHFALPTDEPFLWLADTLAGASRAAIGAGDDAYLHRLRAERVRICPADQAR